LKPGVLVAAVGMLLMLVVAAVVAVPIPSMPRLL